MSIEKIKDRAKKVAHDLGREYEYDVNSLVESTFNNGALSDEAKEHWQEGLYTKEQVIKILEDYFRFLAMNYHPKLKETKDWFENYLTLDNEN